MLKFDNASWGIGATGLVFRALSFGPITGPLNP